MIKNKKRTKKEVATEEVAVEPEVKFVAPAPLPITFQVSDVVDTSSENEVKYIRLSVFTPAGNSVYFIDPATTKTVAEVLFDKASKMLVAAEEGVSENV